MTNSFWRARHSRSLLFLLAMAAIAGVALAYRLPVTLFPVIDFPRVVVSLDAGDQPIEQMVLQVTTPVEEAIRRVPGVNGIRSTTTRGSADISINFDWGINMAVATLQINSVLAPMLTMLPQGTKYDVRRMDPTVFPIISYSLTSDTTPLTHLHDIAQYQLLPILTRVAGVAQVQVLDAAHEEYRVTVDTGRLRAYGLTIDDLSKALTNLNDISAVGKLEEHYKLYLAVVDTRLTDIETILNAVVKKTGNSVIRVRDIGKVTREPAPVWLKVNADGKDAVLINILQQPGSNSIEIAKAVHMALAEYRKRLPADVKLANWYDQSVLVVDSAASVRDAILIGIALAGAILWLFLRNIGVTLVAVIMVPIVLAATTIILQALHMSFNIMTLGGMAAAVGLIIDDAIVMLEHIVRRVQEMRHHKTPEHVLQAAAEFFIPLAGSSGATLVIFIPLVFLGGVTGAFFRALSLTMACALLISFFITWIIIPLLARKIVIKDARGNGGKISQWDRRYADFMQRLLGRPVLIAFGVLPIVAIGIVAYFNVGTGFMPSIDEGGFVLDYRTAPSTSLTETDRVVREMEAVIQATPEVDTYSRRTGAQSGGGLTEANQGDLYVRLKPLPRRSLDDVMDDIRKRIEGHVPGIEIELAKLMEDFIGDLTAVPEPVEIKIYDDRPDVLVKEAGKISEAIAKIKGLVDIKDGINPAGDALDIRIDPDKAALEGSDVTSIAKAVNDFLSGTVATQVIGPLKLENVRVAVPSSIYTNADAIGFLSMRAADGHWFALRRVATFTRVTGQPEVTREDLKRMIAVTGRISGSDTGSVIAKVKHIMAKPGMLSAGSSYELGGLYSEQEKAFKGLIVVFASAIALVFLLLLFLYERFQVALAIIFMPLFSLAAVFTGLWVTGIDLNISAMMGMTMIVGIITEVSVFYFSEYFSLLKTLSHVDALVQAGLNRARPIIMTTLTAILTLLPLAFALGQGAGMQQPLAIVIIAGLLVQLPLVLIVMPILFDLITGIARGKSDAEYT